MMRGCLKEHGAAIHANIRERNLQHLNDKKRLIQEKVPIHDNDVCVIVTGSDGRLERGFLSSLELIILSRTADSEKVASLVGKLHSINGIEQQIIYPVIEQKYLDDMLSLVYAFGNTQRIYPQRVLDGYPIHGNDGILIEAVSKVFESFIDYGSMILEDVRNKVREHKKISETGRQRWKGSEIIHYDLDAGIAYYEVSQEGTRKAFKQGPLRYAQFSLLKKLISLVRSSTYDIKKIEELRNTFMQDNSVIGRFENLVNAGFVSLTTESLSAFAELYLNFLLLYHKCEHFAKISYDKYGISLVEIPFEAREVRTQIAELRQLLESFVK